MLAGRDHWLAVHQHPRDTFGVPVRLREGRGLDDPSGVKDDEVGEGAGANHATITHAQLAGRRARQLLYRRLEGEKPALAHVVAQEAWNRSVIARVRLATRVRAVGCASLAVGADHDPGLAETQRH